MLEEAREKLASDEPVEPIEPSEPEPEPESETEQPAPPKKKKNFFARSFDKLMNWLGKICS